MKTAFKIEILPTVVPDTVQEVLDMQKLYAGTGATIHIDISDGVFAKGLNRPKSAVGRTGTPVLGGQWNKPGELSKEFLKSQKFEVHLMVTNPEEETEKWLPLEPERIIFHHESCKHAVSLAEKIIDGRSTPAVALNLETPVSDLEDVYPDAMNFHLMAIEKLGAQGAKFNPEVYKKISSCQEMFPGAIISVDGGVNGANARDLVLCGASKLCVGSMFAKSQDPRAEYKKFLASL